MKTRQDLLYSIVARFGILPGFKPFASLALYPPVPAKRNIYRDCPGQVHQPDAREQLPDRYKTTSHRKKAKTKRELRKVD